MADARITAEMTMDNAQFIAASKSSTAAMNQVKKESSDLARQISGATSVSNGFAAVLRGDLAGGIAAIGNGLNGLAPKIMALLGPLALVAGAFAAAYKAGKELDKLVGISDAVAKRFGGNTQQTDVMAVQTAGMRQRRESASQAAKIEDETAKIALDRLKGVAKLDAEYAKESAEIKKQIEAAKIAVVRNALQSQLDAITAFHRQDVEAAKTAEAEKLAAVKRAEAEKIEAAKMASASRTDQIKAENESMFISTLQGVNRIQAEFEREMADVQKQIEDPQATPEQRAMLEERKTMISATRQQRLDEAEAKRIEAEKPEEIALNVRRIDSMQAVGGSLGGERANLPVVDQEVGRQMAANAGERANLPIIERETRERQANNVALKNNATAITALTTQIQSLTDAMTGGIDV
jgi:hypothetical protein